MVALGKTLAAGTLAFGTMASPAAWSGMHNGWQQDWGSKHDDGKSYQASYDDNDWRNGKQFYQLSRDDKQKTCNDDHYWLMGAKYHGYDKDQRDKLCKEYCDDQGRYGKHDYKQDYGRKDETAYNKREEYKQSYAADYQMHEKQAVAVKADSHAYDSRKDWGKGYGQEKSGSHDDMSTYQVSAESEKDTKVAVAATTNQATIINNYNYINGDNNVINNNISVVNSASTEQSASNSESSKVSVEYADASRNRDGGYGKDDHFGEDQSFKLAAYNEKDESAHVKQDTSYRLDESYDQSHEDHKDGWKDDGKQHDDGNDCDQRYAAHQKSDCEE